MAAVAMSIASGAQDPTQGDSPAQGGGAVQLGNAFNPQISLVTDSRWNAIDNDSSSNKRVFVKEAEVGLAADVDPYLRAEAYISFADVDGSTEVDAEEVFARYNNLGRGLSLKFGKIAAALGRVQRNHADQLNWMDYPFFVQDMLGDEGLRAGGGSLSYLIPGQRFNEITVEGLDAPDSNLFVGAHGGAPVLVGHYRTFFDFSEDASAQLGISYANGPGGPGNRRSNLVGLDWTYKWTPGSAGKSMVIEAEAFWAKPGMPGTGTAFGGFAAATYQLRPRLFGTLKYDYSETPSSSDIRRGLTAGVTLRPTEFHHWRIEFQRVDSNFAPTRNLLNLQFQWVIGAHPAHKY